MGKIKVLRLGLMGGLLTGLVFISGCVPEGTGGEEGGAASIWPMLIFLVLMFGLMYFVLIRPQRKKQKEHQQLVEELRRGDRVITTGGIYGQIENVSDDSVVLKIESGTTIRVAKSSVAGKRVK